MKRVAFVKKAPLAVLPEACSKWIGCRKSVDYMLYVIKLSIDEECSKVVIDCLSRIVLSSSMKSIKI